MKDFKLYCNSSMLSSDFKRIWNEVVDDWGFMLSSIQYGIETPNYKAWLYNNDAYILHKPTGVLINWYYLTEIGNNLRYNFPFEYYIMKKFLINFKEEVEAHEVWR